MRFALTAARAGALLILTTAAAAQTQTPESQSTPQPTGTNCNLQRPPAEAGVALVGDRIARVHPRRGSITKDFTGCQVVFLSNPGEPYQVAWVIEIMAGDPTRIWSPRRGLEGLLQCRYRAGALLSGNPGVCPGMAMLPMPSRPVGCSVYSPEKEPCVQDGK